MIIKCKLSDQRETNIFVNIMNKVSDGEIDFINWFGSNSKYDHSICIDGDKQDLQNTICLLQEPINHSVDKWLNFNEWSKNYKYIFNWNKIITTENSIYHPVISWFIWWEQDRFDKDVNFIFNKEKKEHLLSIGGHGGKTNEYVKSLYPERKKILQYMTTKLTDKEFHIFGEGWKDFGNYSKGFVPLKSDTMKKYKFAITFENQTDDTYSNGWVTEKIYDALRNYTIPVYWGAPNINEFVPENCFINYKKFDFNPSLIYEYITTMNNSVYEQYLHNIDLYLKSDKYFNINHPKALYKKLKRLL